MTGSGGAVTSVDRDASQVGIDVLAKGGNAADAAVATAAALGVTEPYSAGIGGGGFLVYYDARTHKVRTIDGRETAPKTFTPTTFTKPDGTAMDFNTVVSSGLSVGVPGTPALWDLAARDFGTRRLRRPAGTGRAAGPHGLHGRPDLPRPDRAERRPVRQVPRHRQGVPARRQAARGRVGVHEPGHGQGLRRAPPQGRQRPLPGRARRGPRRGGPRTAHRRRRQRHGRADHPRGPRGLQRAEEGPRPLDVRGPGRLRHAGAELRWHRRGRDPQPHAGLRAAHRHQDLRGRATSTTCTGSARPPRRRSPTATATSATSPACRSRS